MNELLLELQPHLISMAIALLTALGGWLGLKLKDLMNTKIKRDIVRETVNYVEQIGKALGSAEKLLLAKTKALEYVNSKGLKISEVELEILIESFVNQLKQEVE